MASNYHFYRRSDGVEVLRIGARGRDVLANPMTNFGTAFTLQQRRELGIDGLLPDRVVSLTSQAQRVYQKFVNETTDLQKYVFLSMLQDRNEVLFYRLVSDHIDEMLPIVYTPTIGKAIEEYSHWFHRPRGVYLSIDRPDEIESALASYGHAPDEVDLIVVTDSEGILGIGDQGVGGVAITVGKLSVYTAAAGIHPRRALPVVLDVGTDNLELLSDPAYLGVRHSRVRGQAYEEFVDAFAQAAHRMFPDAMIHWEDFGASNAHRILDRYRDEFCTFNDDIQGTAAVVAAAVLSGVKRLGQRLVDQRIVVYGMGTAGAGISNLLVSLMCETGLSPEEARRRFWGLGSRGLLIEGGRIRDFQEPFARPESDVADWSREFDGSISLLETVRRVRPTVLIGTSAQPGSFTQEIVAEMRKYCDDPIIMPLSNPTSKAEATPADLLRWTDGRALIATGSPFKPRALGGVTYTIAQANNALVFPGIGLGVITSKASRVTDRMINAAARAVAREVRGDERGASLLPAMQQLRSVSAKVGKAVAEMAVEERVSQVELPHLVQAVYDHMWQPVYPEIEVY